MTTIIYCDICGRGISSNDLASPGIAILDHELLRGGDYHIKCLDKLEAQINKLIKVSLDRYKPKADSHD